MTQQRRKQSGIHSRTTIETLKFQAKELNKGVAKSQVTTHDSYPLQNCKKTSSGENCGKRMYEPGRTFDENLGGAIVKEFNAPFI